MIDPIEMQGADLLIALSVQLEADLRDKGERPLLAVLARAREESEAALRALADVDPTNVNDIRHLQNQVRRYADLVRFMREIVMEGKAAETALRGAPQESLLRLIVEEDAEALALVGIEKRGPPVE